jgi:hypothetical protein
MFKKIFTPGSFTLISKCLTQGLLPILGAPNSKFGGQNSKFLLRGLLPKLNIFTPGASVHFWGPQTQNLGAKTQNFYSGVFCPKLFLHLKSFLAGRWFHNDEVKEAVITCFASQAASVYDEGIQQLVQRHDKCLNSGGNYVEK